MNYFEKILKCVHLLHSADTGSDGSQMKIERKKFNKQQSVEQTAHNLLNNDLAALLTQDHLHV